MSSNIKKEFILSDFIRIFLYMNEKQTIITQVNFLTPG